MRIKGISEFMMIREMHTKMSIEQVNALGHTVIGIFHTTHLIEAARQRDREKKRRGIKKKNQQTEFYIRHSIRNFPGSPSPSVRTSKSKKMLS